MHLLVLRALANTLTGQLCGRMVRRVGLLTTDELGLLIDGDPPVMLIASVVAGAPHLRLREPATKFRRALTDQLGGAVDLLAGSTIESITPLGWERLLHVALTPHPGAADRRGRHLFVEMLPRTPYLIVAAGEPPEIVAAVRSPGTTRPDRRSMERGSIYQAPFGLELRPLLEDPTTAALAGLPGAAGWPDRSAWIDAAAERLRGVTAAELTDLVGGAGSWDEARTRLLDFDGPLAIRPGADALPVLAPDLEAIETGTPPAGVATAHRGLAPLDAVDRWHRAWRSGAAEGRAHRVLTGHLKRERRRLTRARRALERDQADAARAAEVRRQAETLVAHLHQVRPGQQRIELPDVYGDGMLTIELDPRLKPAAGAEALFQRARRLERRGTHLDARLHALETAGADLDAIEQLMTTTGATRTAGELIERGVLDEDALRPGGPKRIPDEERRVPYRRIELQPRWEVWVGRSNADNDVLTHRLAAPHDWWLHAYGAAGAHVILRRPPGHRGEPPRAILEHAAGIAAHFSGARHSREVSVIVTERRYVRRPRHSPPGTAVTLRDRTIMVEPRSPRSAASNGTR